MNGTVAPSSSRAMAAITCWGLADNSVAIRDSIEGSMREEIRGVERGAHYEEAASRRQDLHFGRRESTHARRERVSCGTDKKKRHGGGHGPDLHHRCLG